ncbi:MAG: HNH endonuclease [Actinomycetota bacterium]|nr:HNH endonuclease [Actinomycetota bacterium]
MLGTLETLGEAIESLEIGFDSSELAQAHRLLDRLSARVCVADGEFDAGEGWDLDAATSMTAWLRTQAGLTAGDAAYAVRMAKRLRSLPVTSAAFLDGTLSGGQVKAIVVNVSDKTTERFAEQEAELVPILAPLAAGDVAVAMRQWKALAEDSLDDDDDKGEAESSLHLSSLLEGRWRLDGDLGALDGEMLATALRLASAKDAEGEVRTPAQRRAAAMVDICSFFLERHDHPAGSRHRPHVNVIVKLEDLEAGRGAEFADGVVVDGPSLASLVCHSVMHRVLMSGSSILDYGTATRTISANLYNALVVRDRHCRFGSGKKLPGLFPTDTSTGSSLKCPGSFFSAPPGCDRPADWCDCHHIVHVEDGGATCPSNCALLCRRHHVRLHKPGWSAKLDDDATLVVTDPSGRTFTSEAPIRHPRPPPELFDVA